MKFKIITDSTADIPAHLLKKYDVSVASLEVIMGGTPRRACELSNEEFYAFLDDCLKQNKPLPTTSQASMGEFEALLAPYANLEDTFVAVLTIPKEMSSTYQSAARAIDALEMKNVHLFDTRVTSFALGAVVVELAKLLAERELTVEEMIAAGNDLNLRVQLALAIGDLRCLRAGGRLSTTSMALGSLLRINPIVCVDRKVDVCAKALGEGKAMKWIAEKAAAERDPAMPLYFGHTQSPELIEKYRARYGALLALNGEEESFAMGAVIGVHSGPGCAGIVYFAKK